ncbi:anaerobic ribonucleoside-triphosphate reductase activating protein [Candidatus Uhrbacteria bacterium]|nr:anaerobic ribonucleoside-triphosphate reductase activating protein [Candidatus Uhrbacteria bacterium]
MLISGIEKFTLLDYPGKTACIVFTPGCNFRCPYCHNSEFVLPDKIARLRNSFIQEDIFFNFLKQRIGLLEGVVISGGEPTLMGDLKEFIIKVKNLGFCVKLDTNGSNPNAVSALIQDKLIDCIAMDIKAPLERYNQIAGREIDISKITESIALILESPIEYEFRSTVAQGLHDESDILKMAELIPGAKNYYLQNFRSSETLLDLSLKGRQGFSQEFLEQATQKCLKYVQKCYIR